MMPIEVGTKRAVVTRGATAITVGKIGPRKKPSRIRPAVAAALPGRSQVSALMTVTPARQMCIRPAAVRPSRVTIGLSRNRPTVSPNQ
jgi:hypothetical protein